MREQLDTALLTDDEMAAGPEAWHEMPDPLPKWHLDSHHYHHHGHERDHSECCGGAHGHKHEHGPCCEHHHHDQAKPAVEKETARP
jgi:hypothetical protein